MTLRNGLLRTYGRSAGHTARAHAELRSREQYTCHECWQRKLPGHSKKCEVIALKRKTAAAWGAVAEAQAAGAEPLRQQREAAAQAATAALEAARAKAKAGKAAA